MDISHSTSLQWGRSDYLALMHSGMLHLALRFRRALAVLLGGHLLATALMAALAACNPVLDAAAASVGSTATAAEASHAHQAHGGAATAAADVHAAHAEQVEHVRHLAHAAPEPSHTPHHHGATPAACPMAMVCAISAVTTDVPTLAARPAFATARVVLVDESLPHSARLAPEPPPPRG